MENMKSARVAVLICLFLIIHVLPIPDSSLSTARSQTTLSGLEGTEWKVTTPDFYYVRSGPIEPSIHYVIENGKVKWIAIWSYYSGINDSSLYYDRSLGQWKRDSGNLGADTKILTGDGGTYKQQGTSVRIEFYDHVIDAVITGNRMEGEVKSKNSAKRAKWSALRATKDAGQSQRPSPGGIGDLEGVTPSGGSDCLPKQGTLIIKMKDGSKASFDLSKAETVTVIP